MQLERGHGAQAARSPAVEPSHRPGSEGPQIPVSTAILALALAVALSLWPLWRPSRLFRCDPADRVVCTPAFSRRGPFAPNR